MAYNPGFPVTYPQYFPQQNVIPPQPQPPQPQQASGSMIWVQGEAGAKSYLLAPNMTLPLWDSEAQTIYLKSTDTSGMPSMKVLDYTIREQSQGIQKPVVAESHGDYVTHQELEALESKLIKKIKEEMSA